MTQRAWGLCGVVLWYSLWQQRSEPIVVLMSDRGMTNVPRLAGVGDPFWAPDPALVWKRDPAAPKSSRPDYQTVSTIGSHWRLTSNAEVVVPWPYAGATLALCPPYVTSDRSTLEAGTILRLVAVYDADAAAAADGMDVISFYEYYAGWSTRTYEIETGPSAGIKIELPTDPMSRYPDWAVFAHTALEPVVRNRYRLAGRSVRARRAISRGTLAGR